MESLQLNSPIKFNVIFFYIYIKKKVIKFEAQSKSEKMNFTFEKYCGKFSPLYFLKGIFNIKM